MLEFSDLIQIKKKCLSMLPDTIDYTNTYHMSSFVVSAFDAIEIEVNADPVNKDIVPVREMIIIISSEDAVIKTEELINVS